jgi:FKBP-type peptidyl-prolyl cis-trans isomerase
MLKTRLLIVLSIAALGLTAAGCGGGKNSSAADKYAAKAESEAPPKAPPPPSAPKAQTVTPSAGEASLDKKPKVPKGSGAAPKQLVAQDLIVGKGPAVKNGDKVSVQYVGVLYKNGKEFDSSWSRKKQAFDFTLGNGQVIKGWDQGVLGMQAGGRRKLIIPASLAYGAQGSPPKIGPNEPLIFDIDLEKIG